MYQLSRNTEAILLLTAPLLLGQKAAFSRRENLTPALYQQFAKSMVKQSREPYELAELSDSELANICGDIVSPDRVKRLLGRGLLLSQAIEHWRSRGIWVISRADQAYPAIYKSKLKYKAPAILYGCGNINLLENIGLAIVGSREINDELKTYAFQAGALAARAKKIVISGAARGVDREAMNGAISEGGVAIGVLSEELERQAIKRDNRKPLRENQLLLISEYDPSQRFSVGYAMARNKLIYALSEHALIVNSGESGGTWNGAVEQLDKLSYSNIFIRPPQVSNMGRKALEALQAKGAIIWPKINPNLDLFSQLAQVVKDQQKESQLLLFNDLPNDNQQDKDSSSTNDLNLRDQLQANIIARPQDQLESQTKIGNKRESIKQVVVDNEAIDEKVDYTDRSLPTPAEQLYSLVKNLILTMTKEPVSETVIAQQLNVSVTQARSWLKLLVEHNVLKRLERPVRYVKVM